MPEKTLKNLSDLVTTMHGVLLEIRGLGVLIIGSSGVGKSDSALDLISKGSKLISDDVVVITKSGSDQLVGTSPNKTKHLLEIRGLGIINIKDLYGANSVLEEKEINLVIELTKWDSDTEYDRLGFEEKSYNIMEIDLPYLLIPINPTRNSATIIEAASLNQLLQSSNSKSKERILDQLDIVKTATNVK